MFLGSRHIRTAGKGSGSIELTLPSQLRNLVGVACSVTLRDGSRPDIVLQPDLQAAQAAFAALWGDMAAILPVHDEDRPSLPLAAFGFGLKLPASTTGRPFLCWQDGLALSAVAPHDQAAASRTLAAFGHAMAAMLGIAADLAPGFGAASGYLLTGNVPCADWQEVCDLAAAAQLNDCRPGAAWAAANGCITGVGGRDFWARALPLLTGTAEMFVRWSDDPDSLAKLRAAWRRGRSIDMNGG
jgi:hypothetical protein